MKLNNNYTIKKVFDSSILIDKRTSKYVIKLNETSEAIINLTLEGKNRSEIASILSKEYDIDLDTLVKDIDELLDMLISKEVLI